MEVKNLRFTCEQVIADSESLHRIENAFDISSGYIVCQICCFIISCFDCVKHFSAELQSFRIRLAIGTTFPIESSDTRVKVPTVIIERTVCGKGTIERLNVVEVHIRNMQETDNNIGN